MIATTATDAGRRHIGLDRVAVGHDGKQVSRLLLCHCQRSEAIQGRHHAAPGLLRRFAPRNDGGASELQLRAVRQLDTDLAVEAVDYAARHSLAMADAIIYATAMKHGADLLTCDAHFANLPGVVYFAKASSP